MRTRLHQLVDLLASLAGRLFTRGLRSTARTSRQRAKRPVRCWFERLEAREVFNATYHGGALIPHVEAQAVFLGSTWTSNSTLISESASIDNFLNYVVQSPYMDLMTDAGFNVGQGTATAGARVSVSLPTTTTDANIRSLLQQAITLKLVQQPDANRLYVVYMPSGITVNNNGATSQTTFLGYHGAFAGSDVNNIPFDIHYAVIPHPGTPNPTSTSQGFTGATEVETLTLGGGTAAGSLTPSFNGVFATTSVFRTNEIQTLKLTGASADTIHLLFNGVAGSDATQLSFVTGISPTAADVQSHLDTIPALNGNVVVTGSAGGPFTLTYGGILANTNVSATAITATSAGGTTTSTVTTLTDGALPTAAQVQTSLGTIAALSGNVTVTGNAGGPFTITIRNLGNANPIDVSGVTGGLTASIATVTDGIVGVTSDLDEMTAVTSHEMAEAVTDPDVNYKTLGWYDEPNNVEIGDLNNSVADVQANTIRLGPAGYLVQDLFNQIHQIVPPDTTSIPLVTTRPDNSTTTALTGITISQISPTQVKVGWTKVDAGASGYRVFLVNGSQTTLLARVPSTADSVTISGLNQLSTVTLKVEAYNAAHTTDLETRTVTLGLPAVQKPLITSATALSSTSAKLEWTSPAQLLTLGGDSAGTFKLAYNGVDATSSLSRVDEEQTLTISGPDGGKIQLSLDGVSGSAPTQLTIQAGVSPTAAEVQSHLSSIPALSSAGAVQVTGPIGGPFTIKFGAGLSGVNVNPITASVASGATAVVGTPIQGSAPSAASVLNNLKTIPALNGHVSVTGNDGGPYTIVVTATPLKPITVSSVTDGVAAAVNSINGATGFRIFRVSGTTKTLLSTLPGTATTATINGLKAGSTVSFIVEAFRGTTKADSDKASVPLNSLGKPDVTRTPLGPTSCMLSWPIVTGAKGYRVYRLTSTGAKVLMSTLGASATSIKINGFSASTKFLVQAFSGTNFRNSDPV